MTVRPRIRLLATLGMALAAAALSGLSAASFSTTRSASSSVGAASLTLTVDRAGAQWTLAPDNLRPGLTRTGDLTLTNSSPVAGTLRLSASSRTGSATLAGDLQLTVSRTSPSAQTNWGPGTVNALAGQTISLGTLAAGSSATYRLTVDWPTSASDSTLQNASAGLTFTWELRS